MNIQLLLSETLANAMKKAGSDSDPLIKKSSKKQFGDYQANGMMNAAKKLNKNPREFAEIVVSHLNFNSILEKAEIAGPGFINLFLNKNWLEKEAENALKDESLNISKTKKPQTIVVDYSAPNIAKEMHVGHLRSTIIGDATVRTLEFLGHNVIRANHIGDWGTQFGMLIAHLEKVENESAKNLNLTDLESFYRNAKKHYDENENFAKKSREYVVKLQNGDPFCLKMWKKLIDITMTQNLALYQRLNVTLTKHDIMGESLYNSMLKEIVNDLLQKNIAEKDNGAVVVFLDEFKNKNGEKMGVIIQKSDGGFLYSTTDLAAIKYRIQTLKADRILYYIDSRQHQHMQQIWLIAQKADYIPNNLKLEHHMFGMMLGKDGKPFKTRSGDTVKLVDLLDEAVNRMHKLLESKNSSHLTNEEINSVANNVAISAVKYADLSKNRTTDYIFDWDNMLSFEGNTAPYLLYAYARIHSIFRKVNLDPNKINTKITLSNSSEQELITKLLQFEETLYSVANEGLPHLMCAYLYELAILFSSFYENCPILNAEKEEIKQSRFAIAALTEKTLKTGLKTIGLTPLTKM